MKIFLKRILVSLLIGVAVGAAISEITFLFIKETARPPQEILLVIPRGSAESVARGEQPPALPDKLIFVVGDVLTVKNDDNVDHQLGPLWIPAGSSASLSLDAAQSFAYECSFQTTNYFGLDVREPLTLGTRVYGILYAGLPLGVLIAVYTFVAPARERKQVDAETGK